MPSSETHSFSVDLGGLIDLLSEHLYSGPEVYVRELMQNGVDAITARQQAGDVDFKPALSFELDGDRLTFTDNGIGLAEADIHRFLATIGRSSKRDNIELIGQFGIGLLAAFLVSEEIDLISRTADAPPVRWIGKADGSYSLEAAPEETPIGTTIKLKARPDRLEYLLPENVAAWAKEFGELLPFEVKVNGVSVSGNAPWLNKNLSEDERQARTLAYGAELLEVPPFDVLDIKTKAGAVEGVAFILPWTPSLERRGQHRVYLKHMLLSDEEESLMPRWAFFVRGVIDAANLRPNAARDALREDAELLSAREEIAEQLRAYLVNLAEKKPDVLRKLIELHFLSIKALAAEDDEFLNMFAPWLPFETSAGSLTLPELLKNGNELRFTTDLNLYRQAAQLAAGGGSPIVRAVYTYDTTLLMRYADLHPNVRLTRLTPDDLVQEFRLLSPTEQAKSATLRRVAEETLLPLDVAASLRHFDPSEIPALAFAQANRDIKRTREKLGGEDGGLWADLLGDLEEKDAASSEVYFNFSHPLIQQAAQLPDGPLLRRVLGMLYVQALLLGQHPLTPRELSLLNGSLSDLIADALAGASSGNVSRQSSQLN